MKHQTLVTLIGLALAQAVLAQSPLSQTLTGTWNCALTTTAPTPVPPFLPLNYLGLATFFAEGQVIAQAGEDGIPSISQGSWLRVGDRQFRSTWAGYNLNAQFKLTGPYKVLYNLEMDEDLKTLRGAYRVDIFDLKGTQVFSTGGKAICTRVLVEDFDDRP